MYPYQYDPRFQNLFPPGGGQGFPSFPPGGGGQGFPPPPPGGGGQGFPPSPPGGGAKGFRRREERSRLQVRRQVLHLHQS